MDKKIENTFIYKKRKKDKLPLLTYENYKTIDENLISKYTVIELKEVCRKYKLRVSGKKQILIDRIKLLFKKIDNVITIQKRVRLYNVKTIYRLKGPAIHNRNICVNNTDPVLLEPIENIQFELFYSYTDDNDKVYGFNIYSLICMIKSKQHSINPILNPYTRENINQNHIKNIITLYNLSINTFHSLKGNYERCNHSIYRNSFIIHRLRELSNSRNSLNNILNRFIQSTNSNYNNYTPILRTQSIYIREHIHKYEEIVNVRLLPINERVNKLFIEIDRLGNYTNKDWFNNLTHIQYARLYRVIYDIWNYRARLSSFIKSQICPFHGPFEGLFVNSIRHMDLSTQELKLICLIVLENLIYSGISDDIKQLSTLHCLTGLTIISIPARSALPWLYESVIL
jgi:hypothetical protein